jgi:hypothetical protein
MPDEEAARGLPDRPASGRASSARRRRQPWLC